MASTSNTPSPAAASACPRSNSTDSRALNKRILASAYETDARDYEAQVAEANDKVAQELTHRYEVQRDTRLQRDAENQRAYPSRMAEITRVNADLAAAFYNTAKADPQANRTLVVSTGFTTGRVSTETSFGPAAPDLFPNRNYSTKSH